MDSEKNSNSEIFSKIYQENSWGDGVRFPKSGSGSDPLNAQPYVDFVKRVVQDFHVKTVVDVGHGDWVMWADYRFEGVDYLGLDVAVGLSEANRNKFGRKNIQFRHFDISQDVLPSAEMVICKDVLQHLPNDQVLIFLTQLSNFKFVVICNDVRIFGLKNIVFTVKGALVLRTRIKALIQLKNPFFAVTLKNNLDIDPGSWRSIDLEEAPFKNEFYNLQIIESFDYGKFTGAGVRKRVYFLEAIQKDSLIPESD